MGVDLLKWLNLHYIVLVKMSHENKGTSQFSLNKDTSEMFSHVCIDEELKIASHVVEGLMILFIQDAEIRKRTKELAIQISRVENVKRILR